ncbi:hypothetical protein HWV23_03660 [Natronomonas halophila]|uniref:transcriptional regulator TbsP n=1 Tax=Natronomonas halophila TaxID=2747817 RepID=UPI0015B5C6AE|nr:DUF5821 family protein [Natronomonas halophila]QLD84848.1 hypothetical protein HWV23_03660 [Natronomonas halophila]
MESNLLERTVADVLSEALSAADDELFVVNPTADTIDELVEVMDEESPTVKLLADEGVLKDVMDDFLVASRAADHVEADRLEIRTYDEPTNTLLVDDESVVSVVRADGRVAGLTTDDEAFIESAYERFSDAWDDAEAFNLRTPAISRVQSTLRENLGEPTADDFENVLASLETARGDGDGLDEVTISLLVAAKNEDLLYDISKWGEDVGIASKATFSRTKSRMEEMGLIDTEKVPIDVGRPRLRLKLGDDQLREASADDLASVAQSMLTA